MLLKAERWRQEHGTRFERSKYVLIHFTNPKTAKSVTNANENDNENNNENNNESNNESTDENETALDDAIHIGDTTIKPTEEVKYLGVIFDRHLSLKTHMQYAAKKGTQFTLAISRIANCTQGPTYRHTRILYTDRRFSRTTTIKASMSCLWGRRMMLIVGYLTRISPTVKTTPACMLSTTAVRSINPRTTLLHVLKPRSLPASTLGR
jgi:hypothetical protein